VGLAANNVYHGDCIEQLADLKPGSIDLVFADPPFNIGYDYDVYHDQRHDDDYLEWSRQWMAGVAAALKPTGTFWLAIGDEYAAELKLIAQNDLGFVSRSWVIWYYTFGINCKYGFSRSHTHLFHFVKDLNDFTFNADNPRVRVPSARQLVYADSRADPDGRLPDNTWILRPQDAPPGGFAPDHDTWYFPRVAGTFKEREGFHGCQMPEQLMGRIIRCCSNPMEIVLDPFAGSGTTLAVAKKLGRRWIGFELSKDYVKRIKSRLKDARSGDPLNGAADPLASAPATAAGKKNGSAKKAKGTKAANGQPRAKRLRPVTRDDDFRSGIVKAYKTTHNGCSVDQLLADPELNAAYVDACKKNGLPGRAAEWNRCLMQIRKSGKLPRLEKATRQLTRTQMDPYSFASEIAMQQLSVEYDLALDDILCDPRLATRFDKIAATFSPGYSPFEYRWAALAIRKRAKVAKKLAGDRGDQWAAVKLPRAKPISRIDLAQFDSPGVYVLAGGGRQPLYIGETLNLRDRLQPLSDNSAWTDLGVRNIKIVPQIEKPYGLQSFLIQRLNPVLNSRLLAAELETVA